MAPESEPETEGRWGRAYGLVLGVLALEVVLLAWMSWSYA
ncbi:MAG: hypothetical protein RL653_3473 [Pseudomonadota bacterium]|jgi:hypothetical protein